MPRNKKGRALDKWKSNRPATQAGCVRVIGGKFRGISLLYSGNKVTRPMKDNTREALFNLVGGYLQKTIVFDLFAGTGVIGIEAVSRGAAHAFLIERHVPTTKLIRTNVETVGVQKEVTLDASDTFFWVRQFIKHNQRESTDADSDHSVFQRIAGSEAPWAVFCCPPYDFFVQRTDEIVDLLNSLLNVCPPGSLFIVESDARFDLERLPMADRWTCHEYAPAILSVLKMAGPETNEEDHQA